MSQGNDGSSKRFVPSGVDAQSWIGFEHRIQERRFKALVETINTAIAQRDGVAARVALEEARELRPGTSEIEALTARVALVPTETPTASSSRYFWYRGASAVAMLGVGVGLIIGIEGIRSDAPATAVGIVASAPFAAVPRPTPEAVAPEAGPAVALDSVAPDAAASSSTGVTGRPPVGASSATFESRREEPNRETFRASTEPAIPASREIPDDNVAAGARSQGRPGHAEVTSAASSIAANVMPQPISITASTPAPVATPSATVTAPPLPPGSDTLRVGQVLQQFARAYGALDSTAAQAVWPTVDERALARAFASLESQNVSFDACDIDIKGALANASCRGIASYVGKVGRQPRTEPRQWNFELRFAGGVWKIERAEALAR